MSEGEIARHLAVTTSRRGRKVTKKTYVEEHDDVEDEGIDQDWHEEQEDEEGKIYSGLFLEPASRK